MYYLILDKNRSDSWWGYDNTIVIEPYLSLFDSRRDRAELKGHSVFSFNTRQAAVNFYKENKTELNKKLNLRSVTH